MMFEKSIPLSGVLTAEIQVLQEVRHTELIPVKDRIPHMSCVGQSFCGQTDSGLVNFIRRHIDSATTLSYGERNFVIIKIGDYLARCFIVEIRI